MAKATEHWERYGEVDPYYGVLSADEFKGHLTPESRAKFFDSGRAEVQARLGRIRSLYGDGWRPTRAVDFGCGVGRLSIPLAEVADYVYGIDVSGAMRAEARRNAAERDASNTEFLDPMQMASIAGKYDFIYSMIVFQHIPVRDGEGLLSTLVAGLARGGVGCLQMPVAPRSRIAQSYFTAVKYVPGFYRAVNVARGRPADYPAMQMNSYRMHRIGRILAQAGVSQWNVDFESGAHWRAHDSVTLTFRKS